MCCDMRRCTRRAVLTVIMLLLGALGCAGPTGKEGKLNVSAVDGELGTTIGMLADVFPYGAVRLKGYALVGGLNGTGSSQCPAPIRAYLKKYILRELSTGRVDIEKIIAGSDTAVVTVEGLMPPAALRGEHFDAFVSALPGTDTRSLQGGWLYGADLYDARRLGVAIKSLAAAEGAIYTDMLGASTPSNKTGYVLGGGTVLEQYKISLILRVPDYRAAGAIQNRLNELFGYDTARAVSPGRLEITVPEKYKDNKGRFFAIVMSTYMSETPELTAKRIMNFLGKLATSDEKAASEVTLEAIGTACLDKLAALTNSSNPEVQLRAARCMLNLGSDRGFELLQEIARDRTSAYRIEALQAIVSAGKSNDAAAVARQLARDEDFDVRLAAYKGLSKLNDITISRRMVADNFYLEEVSQFGRPAVYVSRSGQPSVVLFRAPIYCRSNIFVQSSDGTITINSAPGQDYVSIMRKNPKRPDVIAQLKSSFKLSDIIRTLCEEPTPHVEQTRLGLGVSYSQLIALLQQMSDKGAIDAEFHAGGLPKIGVNIKK